MLLVLLRRLRKPERLTNPPSEVDDAEDTLETPWELTIEEAFIVDAPASGVALAWSGECWQPSTNHADIALPCVPGSGLLAWCPAHSQASLQAPFLTSFALPLQRSRMVLSAWAGCRAAELPAKTKSGTGLMLPSQ